MELSLLRLCWCKCLGLIGLRVIRVCAALVGAALVSAALVQGLCIAFQTRHFCAFDWAFAKPRRKFFLAHGLHGIKRQRGFAVARLEAFFAGGLLESVPGANVLAGVAAKKPFV